MVANFKLIILKRLKSHDNEQLSEIFSFTSSFRVMQILKMISTDSKQNSVQNYISYDQKNNSPAAIFQSKIDAAYYIRKKDDLQILNIPSNTEAQKNFLGFLRIKDLEILYDTICIEGFKNINELLNLLDEITSKKIFFQKPQLNYNQDENESEIRDNKLWFQILNSQTAITIVVNELEKAVVLRYIEADQQINLTKRYTSFLTLTEISQCFEEKEFNMYLEKAEELLELEIAREKSNGNFLTEQLILQCLNDFVFFKCDFQNLEGCQSNLIEQLVSTRLTDSSINLFLTVKVQKQHLIKKKRLSLILEKHFKLKDNPSLSPPIQKKKNKKKKKASDNNISEVLTYFPESQNESKILPKEIKEKEKQKQFFLFSKPEEQSKQATEDQNTFFVNNFANCHLDKCGGCLNKTNQRSKCEFMEYSQQFVGNKIEEILRIHQVEQDHYKSQIKAKEKQKKQKKKEKFADQSDTVSQVTSIDEDVKLSKKQRKKKNLKNSKIRKDEKKKIQGQLEQINLPSTKQSQSEEIERNSHETSDKNFASGSEEKENVQNFQELQVEEQKLIQRKPSVESQEEKVIEKEQIQYMKNQENQENDFIEVRPKTKKNRDQKKNQKNQKKQKNTYINQQIYQSQASDTSLNVTQQEEIKPPIDKISNNDKNVSISDGACIEKPQRLRLRAKKEISQRDNKQRVVQLKRNNFVEKTSSIEKKWVQQDYTQLYQDNEKAISHLTSLIDLIIPTKLEKDFDLYFNECKKSTDDYYDSRKVIQARIRTIVQFLFMSIILLIFNYLDADIQLFGSCKSGLALVESDMDIAVIGTYYICLFKGLNMNNKFSMLQCYNQLIEIFAHMKWVVKLNSILGASVPVLKLEINPSIDFFAIQEQFNPRVHYMLQNVNKQDYLNLLPDKKSKIIQVDLSIEAYIQDYQHLGKLSTDQIIDWTKKNFGFAEVLLILKQIIKKKDLNDYYKGNKQINILIGGINSFCLSVMVAAVFQVYKSTTKIEMLLNFLQKFGFNFNSEKQGVYLDEKKYFFPLFIFLSSNPFVQIQDSSSYNNPLLTVYSPLSLTIISAGTTMWSDVQKEFQSFYNYLENQKKTIETKIKKNIPPDKIKEMDANKLYQSIEWSKDNMFSTYIRSLN